MTYTIKPTKKTSIEALIKEGKYDWSNSDLTKFPFDKSNAKEIELVKFDRWLSSEEAIKELDTKGLRPATATELLLLGAQHPEVQREEHYIVALGTARQVRGVRFVACLRGLTSVRRASVGYWTLVWGGGWRFAAVRKDIKQTLEVGNLGAGLVGTLDGKKIELTIEGHHYEATLKTID